MFNKIMKLCEDNNLRFYFNSEVVPGSIKKRGYFRFKRNDNELGWAFTIFNTGNEYFEMELEMRLEEMLKNLCNESERVRLVALDDFIDKKKYLIDTIDMRDILVRYGVKVRGGRCKCPIVDHGRGDTSAKVFRNGIKCFTCNRSYNIFDIVMKYEYCDFSTAFKILGGDTEITDQQKLKIEENKRLRSLELQKEKDYWLQLGHLAKTIRFCENMLKQGQLEYYHLWQVSCWRWEELFKREKEK